MGVVDGAMHFTRKRGVTIRFIDITKFDSKCNSDLTRFDGKVCQIIYCIENRVR